MKTEKDYLMVSEKYNLTIKEAVQYFNIGEKNLRKLVANNLLSVKLDAPAPCRLDASDLDLICYASADCLHQHLQVI